MSGKGKHRDGRAYSGRPRRGTPEPAGRRGRKVYLAVGGGILAVIAVIAIGFIALGGTATDAGPSLASGESVHGARGGQWIDVTPDRLAQMLRQEDFTLVNVKTPYMGAIDGTDLYIPYDQLAARAGELPTDRSAPILVYCRSGVESAQAAQTLLDLGYRNVRNLDGGMNAWQSSGRTPVYRNRT